MISVTLTVNEQSSVCGVASSFDAVTCTVYVPAGTLSETEIVADAVPPSAAAAVWLVIPIVPGAGDGDVVAVKPVTVPSASVAVTVFVVA